MYYVLNINKSYKVRTAIRQLTIASTRIRTTVALFAKKTQKGAPAALTGYAGVMCNKLFENV